MKKNRLSAHLGYLFNEMPLKERIGAASAAGFTSVEHPNPFSIAANELRKMIDDHGLAFSQLAGGVGDASKGEKGLASVPGRQTDFRESFARAVDYAVTVGSPFVHPMAGVPGECDGNAVSDTYLENIQYAIERAADANVTVLIEAISEAAVPGYAVSTLEEATAIQDRFGPDNIALLIDTFHAAVNQVSLPDWIIANGDRIGHVHIADFPGRHEPGTGTIDFDDILTALDTVHFPGAIGFEYVPSKTTIESLAFLTTWKSR